MYQPTHVISSVSEVKTLLGEPWRSQAFKVIDY